MGFVKIPIISQSVGHFFFWTKLFIYHRESKMHFSNRALKFPSNERQFLSLNIDKSKPLALSSK